MCGLVAVLGKQSKDSRSLFKDMLYADVVRGPHSTGVVAVQKDGFDTWKKAMPAYDFLELSYTQDVIDSATTGLIGHNRWATMGSKTSGNAHPFVHNEIALVHNGTLTNKTRLEGGTKFETDSETIAHNIAQKETPAELKNFLESLEGAYALIWADVDNTVHIAKNDERTLFWFTVTKYKNKYLVLSSERGLAEWLLDRHGFEIKESGPVPVGKIISLDLATLKYTEQEFKPAEKKVVGFEHQSRRGGSGTRMTYSYPQNKKITFMVDTAGVTYYGGTTVGETREYNVELYKSSNVGDLVVGNVYEGAVQSFRSDGTYFIKPGSVKKYEGRRVEKPSGILCGWCTSEITSDELKKKDFVMMGQDLLHTECDDLFMASMEV